MVKQTDYVPARKSIKVNMHSLMDALTELNKLKHSKEFRSHMQARDATLIVPFKTLNLIKGYVVANGLHKDSEIMKGITQADPSDPNSNVDCCNNPIR